MLSMDFFTGGNTQIIYLIGTFILEHVGEIMVDIYECNDYCRCPPFIWLTFSKIKAPFN